MFVCLSHFSFFPECLYESLSRDIIPMQFALFVQVQVTHSGNLVEVREVRVVDPHQLHLNASVGGLEPGSEYIFQVETWMNISASH